MSRESRCVSGATSSRTEGCGNVTISLFPGAAPSRDVGKAVGADLIEDCGSYKIAEGRFPANGFDVINPILGKLHQFVDH